MAMRSIPLMLLGAVLFALAVSAAAIAQEPSASLKEADADYRAGQAALAHNDLKTARAKFEATVRLAPEAEQGHSALGAVLARLGDTTQGIHELEKALTMKPSDSTAQVNLALAYEQTGAAAKSLPLFARYERSEAAEKRALPGYVLEAWAKALLSQGQATDAIAKLKKAIVAEPQNASLHDELGTMHAQAKDWPQAEREYAEAVRIKPDFAVAHLHLGYVYEAEQRPQAVSEWMLAYKAAPDDERLGFAVGNALISDGRDEDAQPILEHVLAADPKSTAAAYQLALILQRSKRVPEAIPLFQSVVKAEPENADALINLGMALSQIQQAKDAVPLLQRAIVLAPKNATAHQDLAAAFIQLNQVEDAERELQAALKITPDAPQLHYNLGLAYKMQDDSEHAIPELETAQKQNPSAPEPAYILGMLYMQAGRSEEAARELELSLKLRPENGDAWATLGSVYNNLNKLPEAAAALREATRQLPNQPDPHLTLANVLVKQNETAEAAAERKIGADLMRAHMNRQRAEVATNSGKNLLEGGKVDDAIAQFREAVAYDPKYAEAHSELAAALDKQGKKDEASAERKLADALAKGD